MGNILHREERRKRERRGRKKEEGGRRRREGEKGGEREGKKYLYVILGHVCYKTLPIWPKVELFCQYLKGEY